MAERAANPAPEGEIGRLEAIAAAAWPAARVETVDGWRLYESGGGPRRTQSVQTSAWRGDAVDASIQACERFYEAVGEPPVFKMTEASEPRGLDDVLAGRGYARRDDTIVQTASLDSIGAGGECLVDGRPSRAWVALCLEVSGGSERDRGAHGEILKRVAARPGPSAFASIEVNGGLAAIGLGAIEAGVCFVGEVATHPAHRRAGHAREIVRGLMAWAAGEGAHEALLQVVAANAPARRIYAELGFCDRYVYWYRQPAV